MSVDMSGIFSILREGAERSLIALYLITIPALWFAAVLVSKLSSRAQARMGPTFAGPHGVLQSWMDHLKLLRKASSESQTRRGFWLLLTFSSVFSTLVFLPLTSSWFFFKGDWALLVPIIVGLTAAVGLVLIGMWSPDYGGFLGAFRLGLQAIAALLPALLSILAAGLRVGGFGWDEILKGQGAWPQQWLIFSGPFYWLHAIIFFFSGPIAFGLAPFDGTCFSDEIHGGVAGRLFGLELTLFRLTQSYALFFWSALTAILFLGAFHLPGVLTDALKNSDQDFILFVLELAVVLTKAFLLIALYRWILLVMPKVRSDQLASWSWKMLCFLSLGGMAGNIIWVLLKGAL